MALSHKHYLYAVIEREFRKTGERIVKFGRTGCGLAERMAQYPKESIMLGAVAVEPSLLYVAEKALLVSAREKFTACPRIGREYFWGDALAMTSHLFMIAINFLPNVEIPVMTPPEPEVVVATNDDVEIAQPESTPPEPEPVATNDGFEIAQPESTLREPEPEVVVANDGVEIAQPEEPQDNDSDDANSEDEAASAPRGHVAEWLEGVIEFTNNTMDLEHRIIFNDQFVGSMYDRYNQDNDDPVNIIEFKDKVAAFMKVRCFLCHIGDGKSARINPSTGGSKLSKNVMIGLRIKPRVLPMQRDGGHIIGMEI